MWWFSITPRPSLEVFWQGCETQFPVCSLSAQRWTMGITIFQLQLKGFPGTGQLRWPRAQDRACSGGHVRCGQWMARAALCSEWAGSPQTCVQESWLLSLGLPSSKIQFRTKEQSFPPCALAVAIGYFIYMLSYKPCVSWCCLSIYVSGTGVTRHGHLVTEQLVIFVGRLGSGGKWEVI